MGATPDNLPDYTVGEFGSCKCYQQCQPGIQTRVVQCEANACAQPEPASKQSCECRHCADCNVLPVLVVQLYLYFAQAALAGLSFLFYLYVGSQKQVDCIELTRTQLLLGFFFKKVPPFVRFLVIIQMVLVLYLVFSTFAVYPLREYLGNFNEDCFRSANMRFIAMFASFIWLLQMIFGHLSKKVSQK